jgi:hypothetical protein
MSEITPEWRPAPGEPWDIEAWYQRAEAAEPDLPACVPAELWDFVTWRERAEALLATLRSLEPGGWIEKEQLGTWYLLARARCAFGPWERWRTRRLVETLRQTVQAHRPYNPIYDMDLYMAEWRRLSPEDRLANYHVVRDLNARRRETQAAQVEADRRARKACEQARRQTQRS